MTESSDRAGANRGSADTTPARRPRLVQDRQRSERRGRGAEVIAAGWLMLRGYRILARRQRTPAGEIDLIAKRGNRIAFVEVKWRTDPETAATSVTKRQSVRIARAAEYWLWRQPALRHCLIGLDCIYVSPGCWPRYVANALQPI